MKNWLDNMELIYIGEHRSRFIFGNKYKVLNITEDTTIILDKDDVPMDFSNDVIHHWFRNVSTWRNEQLEKIEI